MKVDYIEHMGTDLSVVNAARVSFNKESEWEETCCQQRASDYNCGFCSTGPKIVLSERDKRLIGYLAKHNHWTPFAQTSIKLRVKAPIFVARQLFRHQIGLSVNEVSRRYVDSEPEFYKPRTWRQRAENKKQGSSNAPTKLTFPQSYDVALDCAEKCYRDLLDDGVCPEQARMVLPQSMYTEWIWTGSLAAWARIYNQRIHENAQEETRAIVLMIEDIVQPLFPVSWKALMNNVS